MAQKALIEALRQAQTPLRLKDLAAQADRSPQATHRNLAILERAGLIKREGEHREAAFQLMPHLDVQWAAERPDPDGTIRRIYTEWSVTDEVDWRFPLVSRVPDRPARSTLHRYLDQATRRGLLPPWHLTPELNAAKGPLDTLAATHRQAFIDRWADPRTHERTAVMVYGSCARGDAREGSDLDILIAVEDEPGGIFSRVYEQLFAGLSWEIEPSMARPPSVVVRSWKELRERPRQIDARIRDEAITILILSDETPWIEAERGG